MEDTVEFAAVLQSQVIEEGFDPAYSLVLNREAVLEIEALVTGKGRAFGTVKVQARIGGSAWRTTLLKRDGGYVLPVKKPVRLAEGLSEGERVWASVAVL